MTDGGKGQGFERGEKKKKKKKINNPRLMLTIIYISLRRASLAIHRIGYW